jgi:L-alanine-DL-glutamate epimerase-like enolase superfamily enzyme
VPGRVAGSALMHQGRPLSQPLRAQGLCEVLPRPAHWLEWQDWANPILAEPFQLEDGHLLIPDRPGNGIKWDEHAIKRYLLQG